MLQISSSCQWHFSGTLVVNLVMFKVQSEGEEDL
jgi:hypothetical protein